MSRLYPFFAGLAMLFGSTLIFILASSPQILLVARLLQGASSGVVCTVGLTLLVDTVGKEGLGAWMGFARSGMSVGTLIGPFLGGVIYAHAGYNAVFISLLGIIASDFVLTLFVVEKKIAAKWKKNSTDGSNYGTFSNASQEPSMPKIPIANEHRNSSESDTMSARNQAIDGLLHHSWNGETERGSSKHTKRPRIVDHVLKRCEQSFPTLYYLLSSSRLDAALYGSFVNVSIFASFESTLPLFMHRIFGWESSGTGVIFLALTVPSLASPLLGALADRLGTQKVVSAGFAVSTVALALLSTVKHDSIPQILLLCALLVLIGKAIPFPDHHPTSLLLSRSRTS